MGLPASGSLLKKIPQKKHISGRPCGTKRIFELQVIPQLLNCLKANRLGRSTDWGILGTFTWTESHRLGTGCAVESGSMINRYNL